MKLHAFPQSTMQSENRVDGMRVAIKTTQIKLYGFHTRISAYSFKASHTKSQLNNLQNNMKGKTGLLSGSL